MTGDSDFVQEPRLYWTPSDTSVQNTPESCSEAVLLFVESEWPTSRDSADGLPAERTST